MDPLIIVSRFKGAFEHPSEDARKQYLKEHPKADPKNHSVKKHEDGGGADEDEAPKHDKGEEEHGGKKPSGGGGFFKSLSQKAKSFLSHSSAAVQKFVADPEHRKQVMKSATQSIKDSPKVYAKRILDTAREEVHEFKEAGEALKHVMAGKELNHHQKKALKTVAIHMSIAVAAAALTSTGVLAGAAAFGKGMVQKVAMKAAMKSLEHVHLLNEVSHVGHGLHHLIAAEKAEQLGPEETFAALVMQMTLKELENLDDDTLSKALEEASGEQEKQAWKVGAKTPADLIPTLQRASAEVLNLRTWIDRFDRVLLAARSESVELGPDRVWQDRFVKYFEQADPFTSELDGLDDVLDDIYLDDERAGGLANQARQALTIPRKAQVTYAIADIDFALNPATGRQGISYSVDRLKEWAQTLSDWTQSTPIKLLDLSRKAKRIRP